MGTPCSAGWQHNKLSIIWSYLAHLHAASKDPHNSVRAQGVQDCTVQCSQGHKEAVNSALGHHMKDNNISLRRCSHKMLAFNT